MRVATSKRCRAMAVVALVGACRPEPSDAAASVVEPVEVDAVASRSDVIPAAAWSRDGGWPRRGAAFAPALAMLAATDAAADRDLSDFETCAGCHVEVAAQWRTSAHHFASFDNPIYRASVDRFIGHFEHDGRERSRFCAGCHDPSLLFDGAMDQEIRADDMRAHAGVTCRTCHGVESATTDGNGSYTLSATALPIPRDANDTAGIATHVEAMGPARAQCTSCHRAFLGPETGHPAFLPGTDDPAAWQDSSYAGNRLRVDTKVEQRDCVDCHMPVDHGVDPARDPAVNRSDGALRSHRFLGGHTWLAAMRDDPKTQAAVVAFLQDIATVDIAAIATGDETLWLGEGMVVDAMRGEIAIDVVVRNTGVGHRFPGGTRDAQATWLALRILDDRGTVLAEIGERDGHVLRAGVVDEHGRLQQRREVERFRAVAFDHTIGPRDAIVVRHALTIAPEHRAKAMTIEARLLHRSRNLALAQTTCDGAKTPRGTAFIAGAEALLGQALDACAEPPVTEIARATMVIGSDGLEATSTRADHDRLWELGMALSHDVSEQLPEARRAIEAGLVALDRSMLDDEARGAAKARLLAVLGAVAARQGRVDEAIATADAIAASLPGHPYPALLRGRALAQVWRWDAAAEQLQIAARANPSSPTIAAELAIALGSAGQGDAARAVATDALVLQPRRPELLRAWALAMQATGDPDADRALQLALDHRLPDAQPHLAAACEVLDLGCDRERVPVHVHRAATSIDQ